LKLSLAAFGASSSLPYIPAKVSLLNVEQTLSEAAGTGLLAPDLTLPARTSNGDRAMVVGQAW
jgi:hypothetical protein